MVWIGILDTNEWPPLVAIFYYYFFLFLNRIFSAEISFILKYVNCPNTDFYEKNEVLNRIFLAEMCFSQMKSYGSNGDFFG